MSRVARDLLLSVVAWLPRPSLGQQPYPAHPIRLVVPFAPGGSLDTLARLVGRKLGERLGQPVIVENKPGAGTTIGAAEVAKASPDRYTLLLAPAPFVIAPLMYPGLPYDGARDFTGIALLASSPLVLTVNPAVVPAATAQELIALAKARPGVLTYASPGNGSVPHLATELFKLRTGTDLTHVPYKGAGPAVTDLLAGHVARSQRSGPSSPSCRPRTSIGSWSASACSGRRRSRRPARRSIEMAPR